MLCNKHSFLIKQLFFVRGFSGTSDPRVEIGGKSAPEQQAFAELLEVQDPLLMSYMVGRETPTDAAMARVVGVMRTPGGVIERLRLASGIGRSVSRHSESGRR